MSGFQFFHVEGYAREGSRQARISRARGDQAGPGGAARKWGIDEIEAEAMRAPGACGHVASPQPPALVYGQPLTETIAASKAWGDQARDAIGRKLRKDAPVMLAGVISMPADRAGDWPAFRADAIQWLQQRYGDRLRTAVEHTDEANPHLHFYAVPEEGETFDVLHEGRTAAAAAKSEGKLKGDQNRAYKGAMRALQDRFWLELGVRHGLGRKGPARRRLTRSEWLAEQNRAQQVAEVLAEAGKSAQRALDGLDLAQLARQAVEPVLSEVRRQREDAEQRMSEAERYRAAAAEQATMTARTELELRRLAKSELLRQPQGMACLLAATTGRMPEYWELADQGYPPDDEPWRAMIEELGGDQAGLSL